MRRSLVILIAIALAFTTALAAGAGPNCDKVPDHPKCAGNSGGDETPLSGTICDPSDYSEELSGVQTDDFSFTLSGKRDDACIDVISVEGPWQVTITGGGARQLGIIPRDSVAPGDSCGGYILRVGDIYTNNPLTLGYHGVIPTATINACGVDFGEWVDINLEGLNPTLVADGGDCAVIENGQCLVAQTLDTVTHPLVLQAFLRGSGDTTTIHVNLPPIEQ